ncbi:MAG: nucleoside-diphosphate kinase [Candidatus Babeliales bacterium]
MKERTLAIIKPDAVIARHSGEIIEMIEKHGFDILRMQKVQLSEDQVRSFYAVHKDKPFFGEITEFISSGPIVVMVLEKENAVKSWRDLMGATDPSKASAGTIRALFGKSIGNNAVHGSDSVQNASVEIAQFYPDL